MYNWFNETVAMWVWGCMGVVIFYCCVAPVTDRTVKILLWAVTSFCLSVLIYVAAIMMYAAENTP